MERKEPITIRFFITEELNNEMSNEFAVKFKGKNSDGVKAMMYEHFNVEPPRAPSALDKKRARLKRLQEEIEAEERAATSADSASADTAKQESTPAAQNAPAKSAPTSGGIPKPSEQKAAAEKGAQGDPIGGGPTPAKSGTPTRTPAKSGSAQKK